jgi:REP element-mobilizing transposase RayT
MRRLNPAIVSRRSRKRLPHWETEGGEYFVTFRLADSLPSKVLNSLEFERHDIIATAEQQGRSVTAAELARLRKLYSERIERYLDSGAGACWLSRPAIAGMVADALHHFDGERYQLIAWCVMPNHVHVVFRPLGGYSMAKIVHSWKSFTAHVANEMRRGRGEFWEREYYDHLVRDKKDLHRAVRYVVNNPGNAGLTDWPWVFSILAGSPREDPIS